MPEAPNPAAQRLQRSATLNVRGKGDAQREAAFAAAADAIRNLGLVILPTETVYGVAALAASPVAVEHARALAGRPDGSPLAWHAASTADALDALQPEFPLHRRLLRKLTPGPVTFLLDLPPDRLAAVRARLGVPTSVIDDGAQVFLRVPSHPAARRVLALVGAPIVMTAAAGPGRRAPTDAPRPEDFPEPARDHIDLLLDDGPTTARKPSTTIRLLADGSHALTSEGALPERAVRRAATRTVLFVCSGNTCRSPMAAAIASHLLAADGPAPGRVPTVARSAGVAANRGSPATAEAVQALASIGVAMPRHASTPLTPDLLRDADAVFCMTAAHAHAARAADPASADKVSPLDPAGRDIDDPVGSPLDVYKATANAILPLVRQRLAELAD